AHFGEILLRHLRSSYGFKFCIIRADTSDTGIAVFLNPIITRRIVGIKFMESSFVNSLAYLCRGKYEGGICMNEIFEIHDTLSRMGIVKSQYDYSRQWLGKSHSYFSMLKATKRSV